MSNEDVLECREVYNFVNHTITLYAPDGSVLRHDQYTEKSMPALLFRDGKPDRTVELATETQYRTKEEIAHLQSKVGSHGTPLVSEASRVGTERSAKEEISNPCDCLYGPNQGSVPCVCLPKNKE